MRRGLGWVLGTAALVLGTAPVRAADFPGFRPGYPPPPMIEGGAPRYFPRGDGEASTGYRALPTGAGLRCGPRRAATNSPDDPTYVGSPYGLGKPSYHGFTPPLGVDDPYGRRPRPCP